MTIAEQRDLIGTTILDQLARTSGGAGENRLRAMMAATHIVTLVGREFEIDPVSPGVGFRFKGCKKWNGIEIFLDEGKDAYILRFYRMRLEGGAGTVLTLGDWVTNVYAEALPVTFTYNTGLDTRL